MTTRARARLRATRRTLSACAAVGLATAAGLVAPDATPAQDRGFAYSFAITDVDRGPARELERALADAEKQQAAVVIIRMDTPGGLISSMRDMVRSIAGASVPVIVYVSPSGGHAGSAGALITLAGDVAAMAPATNIGSATPVRFGPPARGESEERLQRDLSRKVLNDTAAFARSLAEDHGRNADLAERMIRDAANFSASRALRENVVDVVAPDERALLEALEGFRVKGRKAQRLNTAGISIRRVTAADFAEPETPGADDDSSLLRSFGLAFGGLVAALLIGYGYKRIRRPWRRWRRKRRHRALKRS